jgi:hypothetical protein
MAAILVLFALSVAYRLQQPEHEALPAGLEAEIGESPVTVVILNGCGEAGLAAYTRDIMLPDPRFDVVEIGNADHNRYGETVVADIGGRPGAARDVARYLRRRLGVGHVIRHNMSDPPAEVMVILGADSKRAP